MKDRIDKKEIKVEYCPTRTMLADFFTKPLQGHLFRVFKDVIMGHKQLSDISENHFESRSVLKL